MTRFALFGSILGLTLAAGCQAPPISAPVPVSVSNDFQVLPGKPGPGLVASPQPIIPDVAFPIGFKPLTGQCSASVEADGVRRVHHVYQGTGGAGEAVTFYRQQLPRSGWKYRAIQSGNGAEAILHFTKGPEQLAVQVSDQLGRTTIVIDISRLGTSGGGSGGASAGG